MNYNQISQQPQQSPIQQSNQGFLQVEKHNNRGSTNYVLIFVITIIVSMAIGAGSLFLMFKFFPNLIDVSNTGSAVTNVTKTEKEVTITDTGIADAVEKVYDSVVIVKNYVRGELYSTGTGFVYKKEGNKIYFLTNYHVIENGTSVGVVFTDGSEATVKVEGGDKYSDVAVLSYETMPDIQVADIGSSVDMRVGDTVFAIGAPLDSSVYSWSVTRGVLSGKDREVEVSITNGYVSDWIMLVLQTDAAINSGNSGGPLCNSNGEVIGITNMKLVTDGVEGMGFAIPIEEATTYADKIVNGEDVSRPFLGIQMYEASMDYYAKQYGVDPMPGVLIGAVTDNSPASKAGLRVGDVITRIGNKDVTGVASLRYELYKYSAGDVISITYVRNGQTNSAKLTLVTQ